MRFSSLRISWALRSLYRVLALSLTLWLSTLHPATAQTLLRDAEIEEWIDDYAYPVFRAAGLPAEQINILLIGDPTPNAFAGGLNMGLHTGLFTTADTPNQILGVIAHEAGHIAGGHTARSDEAMAAATRPMLLSLVLAAGAVAAGAPEAGMGLLGLGQNIGMANALNYSRGQESSADQAAITYLDSINASSAGLLEFFAKLRNLQLLTDRKLNPYLMTHPLANQRVTALRERATASPHFDKKDSPQEIYRLQMIQAKIKGFLQESHFTLREYPLSDTSDPAHYARAVAYYRDSRLDKALSEIDTLIEKFPDNPFFHELKGQMLFEFGRIADSIDPHQRSIDLKPDEVLFHINLGRAMVALETPQGYEQAIKALNKAVAIERDSAFAWFELARAYGGLDQLGMAYLATAESRFYSGAKPEAAQFARRARRELKKGTPEWRRAGDIIAASMPKDGFNGRRTPDGAPDGPPPQGGRVPPHRFPPEGTEPQETKTDPEPLPQEEPAPAPRPGDVPDPE